MSNPGGGGAAFGGDGGSDGGAASATDAVLDAQPPIIYMYKAFIVYSSSRKCRSTGCRVQDKRRAAGGNNNNNKQLMGGGIRFTASGGCRRSGLPRASGAHRQVTPWHHHPADRGTCAFSRGAGLERVFLFDTRDAEIHIDLSILGGDPPGETRRDSEIVCESIILAAAYILVTVRCQFQIDARLSIACRLHFESRQVSTELKRPSFLLASTIPAGGGGGKYLPGLSL